MILISKTYSIVTPESAENGDIAESGFVFERKPCTFKELVHLMWAHRNPSCWPCTGDPATWLSGEPETDYETGEETTESIHYARGQPAHNARYWRLAMIASGLSK